MLKQIGARIAQMILQMILVRRLSFGDSCDGRAGRPVGGEEKEGTLVFEEALDGRELAKEGGPVLIVW